MAATTATSPPTTTGSDSTIPDIRDSRVKARLALYSLRINVLADEVDNGPNETHRRLLLSDLTFLLNLIYLDLEDNSLSYEERCILSSMVKLINSSKKKLEGTLGTHAKCLQCRELFQLKELKGGNCTFCISDEEDMRTLQAEADARKRNPPLFL